MFHSFRMRRSVPAIKIAFATALILFAAGCSSPTIAPRKLSPAEKSKRAHALFMRWDENRDGTLSRDELRKALEARAHLGSLEDSDVMLGLGKKGSDKSKSRQTARPLSKEEIAQAVEAAFKQRDNDLNGRLNEEEFKKVMVERPADNQDVEFWESLL